MSRSLFRCRNRSCPVPHGAVLGRVTTDGGLVLAPDVTVFRAFLDTRKAMIVCPACGTPREFRGGAVLSATSPSPRS